MKFIAKRSAEKARAAVLKLLTGVDPWLQAKHTGSSDFGEWQLAKLRACLTPSARARSAVQADTL